MKLISNPRALLAVGAVMLGMVLSPMASATTTSTQSLGSMASGNSVGIAHNGLNTGSFTDWFNFSVDSPSLIVSTANSVAVTAGSLVFGTRLSAFNLYDGSALLATGTFGSYSAASASFESFSPFLTYSALQANHDYTLEVVGTALNTGASYALTVSTAPVPEPETYSLFLAGLGILGVMARRRSYRVSK